ncbi:MAG: hypothetical protein PVF36_05005 [Desulfobacterales bacterium]
MKTRRGRFMKRRAHIHGSKSAVATKIRGRLEYSRSPPYQPPGRPIRGYGQFGIKFEEANVLKVYLK